MLRLGQELLNMLYLCGLSGGQDLTVQNPGYGEAGACDEVDSENRHSSGDETVYHWPEESTLEGHIVDEDVPYTSARPELRASSSSLREHECRQRHNLSQLD